MKNILLPTDFSENSWNAIKYAVQLFKNEKCTFYLFNAYTPVIYNFAYMLESPAQFGIHDAVRDTSKAELHQLHTRILNKFGSHTNHQFETIARFDTLISGIKQLIEERHIDLIIMGTKGATGAKTILFGSNTVQVLKNVKVPVLAIPSNFEYVVPHDILFPTDLKINFNEQQLRVLIDLAILNASHIQAMHIRTGHGLNAVQNQNKAMLQTLFDKMHYTFHDIEDMDVPEAISKFQEAHTITMLAMINNKHSFFENLFFKDTINHIGFYLDIPFLVIPSNNHKTITS